MHEERDRERTIQERQMNGEDERRHDKHVVNQALPQGDTRPISSTETHMET